MSQVSEAVASMGSSGGPVDGGNLDIQIYDHPRETDDNQPSNPVSQTSLALAGDGNGSTGGPLQPGSTQNLVTRHDGPMESMEFGEHPDHSEPPDGGWMAWLHVFAGFLAIFNAQGLIQSYGLFQAYYELSLLKNKSSATIAWIGSFQVFLLFFMCILVNPLIDRGYFRLCFNGGSVLLVVSAVVTSFCKSWWQLLLVQGVLTGAGMGMVFGSGVTVLMNYFSKRIGVASGITSGGGAVGGMIFPAIAERLVFKIGFPWTMRVISLVMLCTMIPANTIVRQRPGWSRRGKPQMDWSMFRDIPFLFLTAGFFFAFWGIYFGFYFIPTYGQTHLLLSPHSATILLILLNATNLPGRLLAPLLSDLYFGPVNTIIPVTFLTSLVLYLWIPSRTHTSLTLIACFYGFFAGAVQGLYNACIWEFSGTMTGLRTRPAEAGKVASRIAVVFAAIGIASLTGAPLGGKFVGEEKGYVSAQVFAGTTVLAGAGFLLAARWAKAGWAVVKI